MTPGPPDRLDVELKAELVLRCAECVPAGRLVSYGDIARIVGTGPRQVGRIMAVYGSGVPWWRATNAKGELPAHLLAAARERWEDEGMTLSADATSAPIRSHRADLSQLEVNWERATEGLF